MKISCRFLPDPQPLYQIYMMEQREGLQYSGHDNDEGVMLIGDNVDRGLKVFACSILKITLQSFLEYLRETYKQTMYY